MRPAIPQAELGHRSERRVAAGGGGGEESRLVAEYISLHGSGYLVIKSCERQCPFNVNERGQSLPFGGVVSHGNQTGLTVSAFSFVLLFGRNLFFFHSCCS